MRLSTLPMFVSAVDADEQWCWARDQSYPTDLIQLPFVQTTEKPVEDNTASHQRLSVLAVFIMTVTLFIF